LTVGICTKHYAFCGKRTPQRREKSARLRDSFGQFPVSIRALLMVEACDVDMNLQFLVKSQGIRAILLVQVADFL
jgi:hypothetical protein